MFLIHLAGGRAALNLDPTPFWCCWDLTDKYNFFFHINY